MHSDLADMLSDCVALLRDKGEAAKLSSHHGGAFQMGRHFGIYESLSMLRHQAIAFGIDLDTIGMGSFDPDDESFR